MDLYSMGHIAPRRLSLRSRLPLNRRRSLRGIVIVGVESGQSGLELWREMLTKVPQDGGT